MNIILPIFAVFLSIFLAVYQEKRRREVRLCKRIVLDVDKWPRTTVRRRIELDVSHLVKPVDLRKRDAEYARSHNEAKK